MAPVIQGETTRSHLPDWQAAFFFMHGSATQVTGPLLHFGSGAVFASAEQPHGESLQ